MGAWEQKGLVECYLIRARQAFPTTVRPITTQVAIQASWASEIESTEWVHTCSRVEIPRCASKAGAADATLRLHTSPTPSSDSTLLFWRQHTTSYQITSPRIASHRILATDKSALRKDESTSRAGSPLAPAHPELKSSRSSCRARGLSPRAVSPSREHPES